MTKPYFFTRNKVNLDITFRCPLECPKCQRITQHKENGRKVHGEDMTIEQFEKITNWAKGGIWFCGQLSDPCHHPQFIDFLDITAQKRIITNVHHASGHKKIEWYKEAWLANQEAKWWFGIDGLPKDSHKYRVNQDGVKLFNIMIEAKKYLKTKPVWQYIKFSYNENDIEEAHKIAKENDIIFDVVNTYGDRYI